MNTTQYLFQSPYNSSVQFGRIDPSTEQNEKTKDTLNSLSSDTNSVTKEAQTFQQSQQNEVKLSVSSANKIDLYA